MFITWILRVEGTINGILQDDSERVGQMVEEVGDLVLNQ